MKTLREVKIGETVKVVKLHGEGPVSAASWTWASPAAPRYSSAR